MARGKGNRWMQRHVNDEFVKKSQVDGYRSRAAYKLLEIQEKDRIIKPGMTVVDLGAAPGGWTQVLAKLVGDHGRVIALDILPMDAFAQVEFIQGDFREEAVLNQLMDLLGGQPVDLVISDLAPNISGMKAVDQPKTMYLVELALDFANTVLKPGGDLLVKVFQGSGVEEYRRQMQASFTKLNARKPKASRSESRELYLLARGRLQQAEE